jgi:hypothetical protein
VDWPPIHQPDDSQNWTEQALTWSVPAKSALGLVSTLYHKRLIPV